MMEWWIDGVVNRWLSGWMAMRMGMICIAILLFFFFVRWSERLENNTRCEQLVVCKKIKQWHLGERVDKKSRRERVE